VIQREQEQASPDQPVVISSLVVETQPDQTAVIARSLGAITGVEVHETQGYKLVVTIEAETVDDSHQIASSFIELPGVLGVNLVYCNFEDERS